MGNGWSVFRDKNDELGNK